MGVRCSIDHDTRSPCSRLLQGIDHNALVIRLHRTQPDVVLCSMLRAQSVDIVERRGAINMRLTNAERIQIWPVQKQNLRHHWTSFSTAITSSRETPSTTIGSW